MAATEGATKAALPQLLPRKAIYGWYCTLYTTAAAAQQRANPWSPTRVRRGAKRSLLPRGQNSIYNALIACSVKLSPPPVSHFHH